MFHVSQAIERSNIRQKELPIFAALRPLHTLQKYGRILAYRRMMNHVNISGYILVQTLHPACR